MDRHTRKELKTDKFAQGVGSGFEFVAHHRGQMMRYTLIGLAVIVVIAGAWAYRSHQATARAEALTKAMQIDEATIGAPQPPRMSFPTLADKEKARIEAFTKVATTYPGSQEGAIAQLAVAAAQSDEGKIDDAIKTFQAISDNAPAPYASVAQLSMAQIYASQGKNAEAEKLLRKLIDNPTVFVSKDQATLELAQLLAKSNPAEARKLVAPLSASPRNAVSRAAVAVLGQIPASPAPEKAN
jgi:predicted negative regulator of RcsB-dependent stress response